MLPVMCMDGAECHKCVRLSQICDPSFDAPRETVVELTAEGHVIITDVSCQPIEHDNVFDNTLIVLHDDVVKLVLGIPNQVESAEIHTEVTLNSLKLAIQVAMVFWERMSGSNHSRAEPHTREQS